MHSVTDRQTDRQTDGRQYYDNSRSYCAAVRSANNNNYNMQHNTMCSFYCVRTGSSNKGFETTNLYNGIMGELKKMNKKAELSQS